MDIIIHSKSLHKKKKIAASFSPSFSLIQSPYIDFSLSKKNIRANNSIDS